MPRKKTHEEFIKELSEVNSNIEVLEKYQGKDIKIKCKCKICGNIWSARPNDLRRGYGCKNCRGNKLRKLFARSQETFVKDINEINENIMILGEYVNRQTKVLVKCRLCGNTFYLIPNNAFNRKRIPCPVCDDGFYIL